MIFTSNQTDLMVQVHILHGVGRKTDASQVLINLMVLLELTSYKARTNQLVTTLARFIRLECQ